MKYPKDFINKIIQGDCLEVMKNMPDNSVDLVVTSPPYDNLRDYKGYSFDFEGIAKELFRVVKDGGVVVWVIRDATINGSETGTSFKQALYFKEVGFSLFDTMIYETNGGLPHKNRYSNGFEYMFILSKRKPKTVNLIKDRVNTYFTGKLKTKTVREKDGKTYPRKNISPEKSQRTNVWKYDTGFMLTTKDKNAYEHPAMFPEKLASDHIQSWSNKGDLVLDPMNGSGTTTKMAYQLGRKYIGIDISKEYCKIAEERLKQQTLL